MPRTKYETVRVDPRRGDNPAVEFGAYHWGTSSADCDYAADTDEGCLKCQDEIEAAEDYVVELFRLQGREIVNLMYVNRVEDDKVYEFEVESRKSRDA